MMILDAYGFELSGDGFFFFFVLGDAIVAPEVLPYIIPAVLAEPPPPIWRTSGRMELLTGNGKQYTLFAGDDKS